MELIFNVDFENQKIERTDENNPIADSNDFLTATFNCTGYDEGMILTPLFAKSKTVPTLWKDVYTPPFVQEGGTVTCDVPAEVIKAPEFTVSIFAYNAETDKRITVPFVIIKTGKSGYANGGNIQKPSRNIFEQLLKQIKEFNDTVEHIDAASLAAGGTTGQALVKASDDDYDTEWTDIESGTDMTEDEVDSTYNELMEEIFGADYVVETSTGITEETVTEIYTNVYEEVFTDE